MTDIGDTRETGTWIAIGDDASSAIGTAGDVDFFTVMLTGGMTYSINMSALGGPWLGKIDPEFTLYDSSGQALLTIDNEGIADNAYVEYTPVTTGAVYIRAGAAGSQVGDYLLGVHEGDIAGNTGTDFDLPQRATVSGRIGDAGNGETDWFRLELDAGATYKLSAVPSERGAGGLDAPRISFYDDTGALIGTSGTGSVIYATAGETGTFYASVTGQAGNQHGTYDLSIRPTTPLDAIDWNYKAPTNINVFFSAPASDIDPGDGLERDLGWNTAQQNAAKAAFQAYANVANLHFSYVTDIADADFVMILPNGISDESVGYWNVGGGEIEYEGVTYDVQGLGVINGDDLSWSTSTLLPGTFGFTTLLHEIGHGLGLAHPHDNGGDSEIMSGVDSSSDTGDYDLNQGLYTVMSYNHGWQYQPGDKWAPGEDTWDHGWEAAPMALDIAALQRKYGANPDFHTGDDDYVLGDDPDQGGFVALWDTAGTDTIRYAGTRDAVISLIAATLDYSWTGGGMVSYVDGIHGGFTIANGVVIENATGGSGDDWLLGNDAANILDGGDGEDTANYSWQDHAISVTLDRSSDVLVALTGLAPDTLRSIEDIVGSSGDDTITGDSGDNWITGYLGKDTLDGGDGADWANYGDSDDAVVVTLDGANAVDVSIAGEAQDSIRNFENVQGGWAQDNLGGDTGDNKLWGAGGDDMLRGGDGRDTLDGGEGDHDRADFSDRLLGIVVALNGATPVDVTVGVDAEDQLLNIEDITGSGFADTLTGDGKNNRFIGGAGRDVLDGKGGKFDVADYSDRALAISVHLNANRFADVKVGGVKEDRVANIEAIFGSSRADSMVGDSKDNFFRGMGGRDVLDGGKGAHDTADYNDKTTRVEVTLNGAKKVTVKIGGHAEDSLKNIEDVNGGTAGDKLTGDKLSNEIYGMLGNDTLSGGAGNDLLHGGWGKDSLIGGAGNDRFFFDSSLSDGGVDTIRGFAHGHDKIALDNYAMPELGTKTGTLSASKFYARSGAHNGHDSNDRVVYDSHSGKLYYDANGDGAGGTTLLAVLSGHPTLSAGDVVIV